MQKIVAKFESDWFKEGHDNGLQLIDSFEGSKDLFWGIERFVGI